MSEAKRTIEDVDHSSADEKRARPASDAKLHREIRYDFIKQLADEQTSGTLLTKLHSIKQRLNQVKSQLSDKDIADWNRHTAYMNTASTIVPYLREHCQVEVGTQAWAKMFEILSNFDLIHPRNDQPWRSLHLCEAPGAFISALNHFLQTRRTSLDQGETKDIQWQWFAQTLNPYYEHSPATAAMLIDDDRLIFHTIDDDHWDFGCDNSGNLLNPENIEHYIQRFQRMEIDFVTADGSFDVQDNPSEQELLVYPLLKTEIQVALACLRAHGHFVIKFFTLFEPATIDLIFSLYRSFAQISMFKPTTSKRGNSEMYVVCRDFDREKWLEDSASISYPHSFAEQLLQCCELFQSSQINTIEENLRHFSHQNRRFRKHLYRIKCQTLERYIHQCQLRELLSTDRHLLKADLSYKHFHLYTHQRARIGTFNDQHQLDVDLLRHPSFCLRCSQSSRPASNELCSICQIVSQLMEDPSSSPSHIFIGQIHADDQPTRVQCVFGQASVEIGNSCFCDRFLLKLSDHQPSLNIVANVDLPAVDNASSSELPAETFKELQRFAAEHQIHLHNEQGVYHLRSGPILTRLQASVVYVLCRTFEQTCVYVIRSPCPHLFFHFQTSKSTINEELPSIPSSNNGTQLLQFVHLHQLLAEQFVFNLIQANNLCLQLTCVQREEKSSIHN